eukprot:1621659-Heterocapsa_arctica.AAC.1
MVIARTSGFENTTVVWGDSALCEELNGDNDLLTTRGARRSVSWQSAAHPTKNLVRLLRPSCCIERPGSLQNRANQRLALLYNSPRAPSGCPSSEQLPLPA